MGGPGERIDYIQRLGEYFLFVGVAYLTSVRTMYVCMSKACMNYPDYLVLQKAYFTEWRKEEKLRICCSSGCLADNRYLASKYVS